MRWKAVGATRTGSETSVPSTVVAVVTEDDVDEHARPQHPAAERGDVLAGRPLVVGAADEVAERPGSRRSSAARS